MRDDGDFIQNLRKEIESTQARRHKYVLAKLVFVTGLLGIGVGGKDASATGQLLYLVPVVTFVFDLYILGEDFSVKRAGRFIRKSSGAPIEEKIWEECVARARDWFSYFAGPLSSGLALVAAIFGLRLLKAGPTPVWWIVIAILFVLIFAVYRPIQSVILDRFDQHVHHEREHHKAA